MAIINFARREIEAKVVYYGPALSGKTTNVIEAHARLPDASRGKLHTLTTEEERTLFFDYAPITRGEIAGFTARFKLFSVPGQVFYKQTRRVVLRGADAVVFVADSSTDRAQANIDSLIDLEENLRAHGLDLASIPLVIQLNKRDLAHIRSVEAMATDLNPFGVPVVESVAIRGEGVMETLEQVTGIAAARIRDNLAGRKTAVALTAIDQREPEDDELVIRRHLKEIEKVRPQEEEEGRQAVERGQVDPSAVDAFLLQNVERAGQYLDDTDRSAPRPRRAPAVTGVPRLPPGPAVELGFLPPALGGYRATRIVESSVSRDGGIDLELLLEATGAGGVSRCTVKLQPRIHRKPPSRVRAAARGPEPRRPSGAVLLAAALVGGAGLLALGLLLGFLAGA